MKHGRGKRAKEAQRGAKYISVTISMPRNLYADAEKVISADPENDNQFSRYVRRLIRADLLA